MRCSSGSSASLTSTALLIFSANLPLNQYIAKLKTTAMMANTMIPLAPPIRKPISRSSAVSAAISRNVLMLLPALYEARFINSSFGTAPDPLCGAVCRV